MFASWMDTCMSMVCHTLELSCLTQCFAQIPRSTWLRGAGAGTGPQEAAA